MFGAIIVVICIIAVLLVFVVLVQNPKGGGLSGEFGTAGASQMFGVQRTGDLLEQITWGGAISIALLVLATKFITPTESTEAFKSVNTEAASKKAGIPAAAPALGTNPTDTSKK
ncbi:MULTISPECIES: preprotein translocase subunit SecG [unclassified Arcicella]|uniref:preprotein translocase subunit SecG n=1 Tax=unclassified Arcicella TaxID=2644986 RepID=UPI0028569E57|nr:MULTISPECIES: preprotein translocase subunit SecG [unclassified Arcicella]MDR6562594.1 preprotein translocase subunit SecG [Arcicella sp. BE51]MDR6812681.1 preprotein translocase subunit SecG [Arcicella sp. BE140]MDR6823993.1 preprotein translocase subunit SecG [Arcicella sp. BE139]